MPKQDGEDKPKDLLLLVALALFVGMAVAAGMVSCLFNPRAIFTSRWFTVLAVTGFVIGCLVRIWKAVCKAARKANKQKFGRYSDSDRYWSDDVP